MIAFVEDDKPQLNGLPWDHRGDRGHQRLSGAIVLVACSSDGCCAARKADVALVAYVANLEEASVDRDHFTKGIKGDISAEALRA